MLDDLSLDQMQIFVAAAEAGAHVLVEKPSLRIRDRIAG